VPKYLHPNAAHLVSQVLTETTEAIPDCALVPLKIGIENTLIADIPAFGESGGPSDGDIIIQLSRILYAENTSACTPLRGIIYLWPTAAHYSGFVEGRILELLDRIYGEEALSNLVIITPEPFDVDGKLAPKTNDDLKEMFRRHKLGKVIQMGQFSGDAESAQGFVSRLLPQKPVKTQLLRELTETFKKFQDTAAGEYLHVELEDSKRSYERLLKWVGDEMEETVDIAAMVELEGDLEKAKQSITKIEEQQAVLNRWIESMAADKLAYIFAREVRGWF